MKEYFVVWQMGGCRWMRNNGDAYESKRWIWTTKWFKRRQWAGKGHYTMQALGFALCSNSTTSAETVSSSRYHINTIFNNTELTHSLFISRSHGNLKYPPPPIPLVNSLHDSLKKSNRRKREHKAEQITYECTQRRNELFQNHPWNHKKMWKAKHAIQRCRKSQTQVEKLGPSCSWHLTQSQTSGKRTETTKNPISPIKQTALLCTCAQEMGGTRGVEGKNMAKQVIYLYSKVFFHCYLNSSQSNAYIHNNNMVCWATE